MSHKIILKEGAYFIADAHYSQSRPELYAFLEAIERGDFEVSQLILMGDIFDALFLEVPQTQKENASLIVLIQKISHSIETLYLEGNHDFNLKKIFPNIEVFPLKKQALVCSFEDKKVLLAHGDFDGPLAYRIYTAFIRNSLSLRFLNFINFISKNAVMKKLEYSFSKKDDCKKFKGFESFVAKRLQDVESCEYFIEGHFHQNRSFTLSQCAYTNLGAFACKGLYGVLCKTQEGMSIESRSFYAKN